MTPPQNKETMEDRFDNIWSDAGLPYPNRKSRVKSFIQSEITKAKLEVLEELLKSLGSSWIGKKEVLSFKSRIEKGYK